MKIITYGVGGYDPTLLNNNAVGEIDLPDPPPQPLDAVGALATLLAVVEVVTVVDAANAVGLTVGQLISEAQAWRVASEISIEDIGPATSTPPSP